MRRLQNTMFNIRRASNAIKSVAIEVTPTLKSVGTDALNSAKAGWNGEKAIKPIKFTDKTEENNS